MEENKFDVIGQRIPIRDAAAKVTGTKVYVGDMKLPGMLYAKVLHSPKAHAKIISIDTTEAENYPGVRAVATYKNTPQVKYNSALRFIEHQIPNTERIFDDTVRFVGDRVAAVAADTLEAAEAAVKLIKVQYEDLPVMLTIDGAIKEGAYPIHGNSNIVGQAHVDAGNVDEVWDQCDYIIEDYFTTQPIHHVAVEPHIAIAQWEYGDKLTVYTPCQNIFGFRVILSQLFGMSYNKIRVVTPAIGGAFGGKLEMTIEPVATVLSKMTRRPVRLEYTRKECITSTRVRHASKARVKTGFMKDGTIKAMDLKLYTNTGAYATSALNVAGAMSHKVFKAYKIDNMRFHVNPVYTNTIIAGAMRGYGSPQAYFGMERQFNKIANFLHMDPAELQMKNMVDPDSLDPCFHKPHGNPRPKDCLKRAMELIDYDKICKEQEAAKNDRYRIGVGVALGVHGNNCFGAHRDVTTLMLKMNEDGSCILYTGSHDMGNDNVGMQKQIISEVLGISLARIDTVEADTDACMWHLGDYASRGTYVVGMAAKKVAEEMKKELQKEASDLLRIDPETIILKDDYAWDSNDESNKVSIADVMLHCQKDSMRELNCCVTHPAPRGPSSYGVHIAKVCVDMETGETKVLEYAAVQDVGCVINPLALEGQLAGGIHMGLGMGLCENITYDENGTPKETGLKKYKILRASEMPKLYLDFIAEGEGESGGPYGAKSLGECPVVPAPPAVVNAICNAIGAEINDLPADSSRVKEAIASKKN